MTYKRLPNGQFEAGTKGGPGNPFGKEIAKLRSKLFKMITKGKTFEEVVSSLINQANNGNVAAIKIIFEYTLGKPTDPDTTLALQALQLLSRPLEDLIDQILTDPEQRRQLRNKLAALEVADQVREEKENASEEPEGKPS